MMMIKQDFSECDPAVKKLVDASITARRKAYAPYSKFLVGSALLSSDGIVYMGCNVENVSFGLTICAERTSAVKAISEGCKSFEAIAITGVNKDLLVSPCGACRQFLAEFNPKIKVYLHNPDTGEVGITSLAHLLPESFIPENVDFDDLSVN